MGTTRATIEPGEEKAIKRKRGGGKKDPNERVQCRKKEREREMKIKRVELE